MIVLVNKKKFFKVVSALLVLVLAFVGILNFKNIKKGMYPMKYQMYVEKYSAEYNLDKFFVYSVIKAESNFDSEARSNKSAAGLMQLMPDTAEEIAGKIGIENFSEEIFLSPEVNIQLGCYYLSFLMERYSGDIKTAAAAYNAGYNNIDTWLAQEKSDFITEDMVPFGETKKYIKKVENYYNKYKELYGEE